MFVKGVAITLENGSNQNEMEFLQLVLSAIKATKLSIINEGKSDNHITFTNEMNVDCIKQLMYWDENASLSSISISNSFKNLEQLHFNKTQTFPLSKVNFSQFKKLEELIIETKDTFAVLE